jgi:hypothetical protein
MHVPFPSLPQAIGVPAGQKFDVGEIHKKS